MNNEQKISVKKQTLPVMTLRNITVFPYMLLHFDVNREETINAIENAVVNEQLIFLLPQKDPLIDNPKRDDLYDIGTIAHIKQILKLPGNVIRVLAEGIIRAEVTDIIQYEPFIIAEIMERKVLNPDYDNLEYKALSRKLLELFETYCGLSGKVPFESMSTILRIEDIDQISDSISANLEVSFSDKQEILAKIDLKERLEHLIKLVLKENEILKVEKDIHLKVKQQIDKHQKEYYLKEQLKAIQEELGDKDSNIADIEEYTNRLNELKAPDEVIKKIEKELDKLRKMPSTFAESAMIKNYIECVLDLPWSTYTEEIKDLNLLQTTLDEDHYGLEEVKERIIEYLAVRLISPEIKGSILCLSGPPGVGKTSIAKSIAAALNRNYVRISLGGTRDESDIRGHRRTYVGSMPGRIITALKNASSKNSLILLDEIDKMSMDFKGDPAAALLEVLDPEQNSAFRDHYLELNFDLSEVMFITTANFIGNIPKPLLDRMEVITLSSYTEEEKIQIASKYLVAKQLKKHGLKKQNLKVDRGVIKEIVNYYTKEAGVRALERQIAKICRKSAVKIVNENRKVINVTSKNLESFLGVKKFSYDKIKSKDEIGVATGLAWTALGGDTLSIEVNVMPGKGKIELTGSLGDVMKESARAAISYIRSISDNLNLENKLFYEKNDIHIHVPEGATPKDGPSAGITIATAIISALTMQPVRKDIAMTGEITLRGRVLPIGGLKEKALAAFRAGIFNIIIPAENEKNLQDIPADIRNKMNFIKASTMETVIQNALIKVTKINVEPMIHKIDMRPVEVLT